MRRKFAKNGRPALRLSERRPRGGSTKVAADLQSLLGLDPYRADFELVARRVRSLEVPLRDRLLSLCREALRNPEFRRRERVRVSVARVLVAAIPDSMNIIREWLRRQEGRDAHEVHFSLFCYLDRVVDLPGGNAVAPEVLALVESYLIDIDSKTAQAAWMAGDLLGDHWAPNKALPVLVKVARTGRFPAGRKGALHGLAHLLTRVGGARRREVVAALREIAVGDQSEEVRAYAGMLLKRGAVRTSCGRSATE